MIPYSVRGAFFNYPTTISLNKRGKNETKTEASNAMIGKIPKSCLTPFRQNLSLPKSIMETRNVHCSNFGVWCDHSNGTSLAVLLHSAVCFSIFYIINFGVSFKRSYG